MEDSTVIPGRADRADRTPSLSRRPTLEKE